MAKKNFIILFLKILLNKTMHFLEETTTESPEEVIKEPDENGPLIILAAFIILCVGAIVKQFCI